MCRLLAYLGPPVSLAPLLLEPEHSLIVQSYQPKEMEVALLNADGFGVGWYHPQRPEAYTYRSTQPIWNDVNLPPLCRYIESGRVLAYVRSATPGLAVDLHNCQPFQAQTLTFIHNGFIENFRHTLYRPVREQLCDRIYQSIHGLTDSEHIFALLQHQLAQSPLLSLAQGLQQTLTVLRELAAAHGVRLAANIIVSDGQQLVACRFDSTGSAPSLYWLQGHPRFPGGTLIASEPLFAADWVPCPADALITLDADGHLQRHPLFSVPVLS